MKFRISLDNERCKGCALCVSSCIQGIVKMSKKLNSKGYHFAEIEHPEDCKGCRQCAEICPDAAIEIEKEDD